FGVDEICQSYRSAQGSQSRRGVPSLWSPRNRKESVHHSNVRFELSILNPCQLPVQARFLACSSMATCSRYRMAALRPVHDSIEASRAAAIRAHGSGVLPADWAMPAPFRLSATLAAALGPVIGFVVASSASLLNASRSFGP